MPQQMQRFSVQWSWSTGCLGFQEGNRSVQQTDAS